MLNKLKLRYNLEFRQNLLFGNLLKQNTSVVYSNPKVAEIFSVK